jgi:MFS family permease
VARSTVPLRVNRSKRNPQLVSRRIDPAVKALVLAATILLTLEAALALLVQLYLKDLGASPLLISLSGSLTWAGILLASPIWGGLGDRYSSRWLVIWIFLGTSLATVPLVGLLAAPVILVLGTVRSFLAIGIAPIGMRLISALSTDANRGRNLSFLSAARAAGFVFGGMLAGYLLERAGYRVTFFIVTMLPILVIPALFRVPHQAAASNNADKNQSQGSWRDVWTRQLTFLYSAVMLRQLATTGVGALAYVYMSSHALSSSVMGIVGAVNPAVAVLATLVFGNLVDRMSRKTVIVFGFAIVILYPLVYSLARTPFLFAVAGIPLGLSFGAYYSGSTAHIGRIIPLAYQGTMFGLLDSCRGLGGLIGPVLAGTLVTIWGYHPMFMVMAGIMTLALVLSVLGTRGIVDDSRNPVDG